jgi:hypothetical protein
MSVNQRAMINGLLAENLGKNDLIRGAEARSRYAESKSNDMERRARAVEIEAEELAYQVRKLKKDLAAKENENEAYKNLLSRPMKEIAEVSGDFKKTYEVQQQLLAEWIMGQKAYRETAMQLGMALDMTPEQVQKVAAPNYTAVLENKTNFGNDGNESATLTDHAATILAIRKKNGKS